MESFTFSMNWPRAKCIVLVGEDDILFCFLIFFSGLLSPDPCATFSYHRNVDGRAPADQKGLQNTQDVQGHMPLSLFSSFVTKYKGSDSEAP